MLNAERRLFNAAIPKRHRGQNAADEVHEPRPLINSIDNFAGSFDSASLRSG
jgi:hypothetical protein